MGKAIGGHAREAPLTQREAPPAQREAPPAEPAGPEAAEGPFAVGGWLARQRELRGIRLEELAAMTRLPVRSLERLEAGAFDGQQDGFVRGFVRTVAVAIGLDPEDAVARLLAEPELSRRRRLPDPRRVAVAAIGLAAACAAVLAVLELTRARAPAPPAPREAPLGRRDAIRALAVEHRLLAEDPAAVLMQPLPAGSTGPRRDPSTPLGAAVVAEPVEPD
ncbi:MAG: helix-turn-helix transcriptional regulator [Myxococcota bacterium]